MCVCVCVCVFRFTVCFQLLTVKFELFELNYLSCINLDSNIILSTVIIVITISIKFMFNIECLLTDMYIDTQSIKCLRGRL